MLPSADGREKDDLCPLQPQLHADDDDVVVVVVDDDVVVVDDDDDFGHDLDAGERMQ